MATDEPALPEQPRRRLRFSLRSLVLFTLLLANILIADREYPWQKLSEAENTQPVSAVRAVTKVISPRDRIVVTPNDNGYLSVRNADTGELIRQLQPNGKRTCSRLEFTPDGKRLIAEYDRDVVLWNAETWEPIRTLHGTVLIIHQMPDRGGWIVLDDSSVTSVDEGITCLHDGSLANAAAFSANSSLLLLGNSGEVVFYSTKDWEKIGELPLRTVSLVRAYFEPDGLVVTETIDVCYKAKPGFLPKITRRRWLRTAPWGYDSNWYRGELWTLPILAVAFLISLWHDRRDLRGARGQSEGICAR
jgi:WD40 repeat protein